MRVWRQDTLACGKTNGRSILGEMAKHLVTSALPYANGPIHFGHVAGAYLPADVYVRYLRMKGEEVLYVCGTDEHGVAITLKAEQAGLGYQEYVDRWHKEIQALFERFGISFDIWSGTARCPHHADTCRQFFQTLLEGGFIFDQTDEQWYSESLQRFLPDRYLEGGCPECGHDKARGDECPKCGAWIEANDLKNPICTIDGSLPVLKKTKHWYLDLPKLQVQGLQAWYDGTDADRPHTKWKPNVHGYVQAMLKDLHARPITRDLPWGVSLPEGLEGADGKVLYVWFDAPIGYISATMEWAEKQGDLEKWKDWWLNQETKLSHFIGKDNIAFHMVVFPSMLLGQETAWDNQKFILPWSVPANEFYNLQGKKFSTSEGWHLDNDHFFAHYDSDAARFYLIWSGPETADSEFTWEGFQVSTNSLLADKLGNFASRVLKFLDKRFDGKIPQTSIDLTENPLLQEADGAFAEVGTYLDQCRFKAAAKALMNGCDALNQYFDGAAPWKLAKSDAEVDQQACAAILERCVAYLVVIARRMSPFCPAAAKRLQTMLGGCSEENLTEFWGPNGTPPKLAQGLEIGKVEVLFQKIENDAVQAELTRLNSVVED